MTTDYPFTIRMALSSSVIVGQRLTLDGILAALIFARTKNVETAHNAIPLRNVQGVWAGSAALIEGPAPIRSVAVIQSLRAKLDVSPDMIAAGKRGYPRIETARGNYRNQMTSYIAHDADAVWFTGRGDIDKVKALLMDIPAIGAKRNIGYGKVVQVDLVQTGADNSGIAFSDGSPARPVPADAWASWNGIDCEMAMEACCPPYWGGVRVLCAIPHHQVVDRSFAKKLTGSLSVF